MSTQVDRLTKLTSQLVGDVVRLPGVTLDQAGEAQLVQLLTDAFEAVGLVALGEQEADCTSQHCGYAEPHFHTPSGDPIPYQSTG